jgi:arabinose-5-phosphate isomerase
MIQKEDIVLAISNSGETDELNSIIPVLKSLGLKIIALTSKKDSTLARFSDLVLSIAVPREACALNLAPTASTTATLALGDAIAVSLTKWKSFKKEDFQRFHPGGDLGRRLALDIDKIMQRENLPMVREGTKLKEAIKVLDQGGLGSVMIVDEKKGLKGIITDGDVRRMVVRSSLILDDPVEEHMTKNPRFGLEGEKGAKMLDIMEQSEITVLPVVDREMVVKGIVHLHDLLGKGRLKFNGI